MIEMMPPLSYIGAMILTHLRDGFDPRLMPDAGSRVVISFVARRLGPAPRRGEVVGRWRQNANVQLARRYVGLRRNQPRARPVRLIQK